MPHKHYNILLTSAFILSLLQGCHTKNYLQLANAQSCMQYEIIKDDLGIFIEVAVDEEITEEQMRCILVEVANKHQFDNARDYLWSDYLWVEIYMRRKGATGSQNACGKLRRFVLRDKSNNISNPENDLFLFSTDKCVNDASQEN